jgi:hypothetical protein
VITTRRADRALPDHAALFVDRNNGMGADTQDDHLS